MTWQSSLVVSSGRRSCKFARGEGEEKRMCVDDLNDYFFPCLFRVDGPDREVGHHPTHTHTSSSHIVIPYILYLTYGWDNKRGGLSGLGFIGIGFCFYQFIWGALGNGVIVWLSLLASLLSQHKALHSGFVFCLSARPDLLFFDLYYYNYYLLLVSSSHRLLNFHCS
jgi:hypothetical protein